MPRNYARERAQHALEQPGRMQDTFDQLTRWHGDRDEILVGWTDILTYLTRIGIRRPNGCRVNDRMLLRWRRDLGFPLCRGTAYSSTFKAPPLTSAFAITAWLCSQLSTGEATGFRYYDPTRLDHHPDQFVRSRPVYKKRTISTAA
jgi:hypothetical protein